MVLYMIDEMKRTFLTKTARTQFQTIMAFREPFKLVPISELASIADTFTRNEIMTSNELRQIIGMRPSDDPDADVLRNKNMPKPTDDSHGEEQIPPGEEPFQMSELRTNLKKGRKSQNGKTV